MPGKIDLQRFFDDLNENETKEKTEGESDTNNANQEGDFVRDHVREILDDILNPKNN